MFLTIPIKSYAVQAYFSGNYEIRWITLNNADLLNPNVEDNLSYGDLRFVLKSVFEINENTKGVVALETGHTVFGIDADSTSDEDVPGDDSIELELKNAYVDFILPNSVSNFIFGLQPVYILDGLLANEDAFGITYRVEADRFFEINYVKILDNKVDDKNFNTDNTSRTSKFFSMFYENDIFTDDIFSLLIGYYVDKDALIDNVMYSQRNATYFGLGYEWEKFGADFTFNLIYGKGRKKYTDATSGNKLSTKNAGYLADFKFDKSFKYIDLNFEFMLATGDDNDKDSKDREFIAVDGLTNFYDRAYILTGYLTKEDADEKAGIFDTSVYNLTNVVFFRLGTGFKFSKDKRLDLAFMYALNDKKVEITPGRKRDDIGGEVDATFSVDLFDTYYDDNKGLLFELFSAYFVPGRNYQLPDGTDPDDVYLIGTGLKYVF